MDNLMDKLRALGEKIIPLMIVGALGWGGWTLYKQGTFRHGIKPAISQIVGKIPYFGTRFRHYLNGSSKSYVAGRSRGRVGKAHHRKGGRSHHRRHRRHR